ncbi:hypothetical protein AKJ53_00590 [candidate division MSBL1 archaeon SCGC-AAA382F02]|uniref:Carbohydrate kinase PfkB domain-containing protein n=1 Tax=candidate division MSBL1 archaeon SCGC-AAA382F02 TaxID=1698282 RepID=A0A133VIS9_9EURY|nr:hypothetical protein AKJ53_00590 [candidate division MSBL1 archaeon SCGC-AAA382F02]
MRPKIAVGLESTLDILIHFESLGDFQSFVQSYDGELSSILKRGYETVSSNSGDEVPIDGRVEEAQRLLELAKEMGADVHYTFGGNGSQEAATLERMGVETIFLGGVFPNSFSKLSPGNKHNMKSTDTSFAHSFEKYTPASYIFQATGTNRFILADGEGRRIEQLRPYLKELPEVVEEVVESYDGLDALSLVGWQVVFGNELDDDDFQLTTQVIEEIREKTDALLFTDAGGIGGLDKKEREKLWNVYSLFDILSLNEDELGQILEIPFSSKEEDEVQGMLKLLEEGENLSTIWLHTPHYHVSLSSDFSKNTLKKAQKFGALAGLYKVEKGKYPNLENLSDLEENRDHSSEGIEKCEEIHDQYEDEIDEKVLVATPCYEEEEFVSTVGAGDVSAATYLYSITKSS